MMTNNPILTFVDTETTGLDPDRHDIWEVAAIRRCEDGQEEQRVWQLPVDLGAADPMALKINGFHERRAQGRSHTTDGVTTNFVTREAFAREFMGFARGTHLVGAVVSFDEERLRRLLRANGACESWHYHIIDVEALAVGHVAARGTAMPLPWKSGELSQLVGVEPDQFPRHTALGDAMWARAIYDAIIK